MATVDIILSVFNGSRFIQEQIRSIQAQTHGKWRLWVRDDGSTDDTEAQVREMATVDPRIHLHPRDGRQRGASGGFSWLMERLPDDCLFVACSDADDVWLPGKLSLSLDAIQTAETGASGPVLVHTDLTVTDSELNQLDPSLWHHLGICPEPVDLRRLLVENVVTGPTIIMNRPLLDRVRPIPPEVPYQDWWIALVATAFGQVVALPQSTVLYRRHGGNLTEAYSPGRVTLGRMAKEAFSVWGRTPDLRKWLSASALQAGFFLNRFRSELRPEDARLLEAYAEIPNLGFLPRKLRILRYRALPEHGVLRNLALLLRG